MRFDIDDNWLIDSDNTAVTLYRKIVISGNNKTGRETKAENIGKVRESNEGSYGNIRDALIQYMHKSMRMDDRCIDLCDVIGEMDRRVRAIENLAASFAAQVPAPAVKPSTPLKLTPPVVPKPTPKAEPIAAIQPVIAAKPAVVAEPPKKPVVKAEPPKPAPAPVEAPKKRRFAPK